MMKCSTESTTITFFSVLNVDMLCCSGSCAYLCIRMFDPQIPVGSTTVRPSHDRDYRGRRTKRSLLFTPLLHSYQWYIIESHMFSWLKDTMCKLPTPTCTFQGLTLACTNIFHHEARLLRHNISS